MNRIDQGRVAKVETPSGQKPALAAIADRPSVIGCSPQAQQQHGPPLQAVN
jgi:hypothetical protein